MLTAVPYGSKLNKGCHSRAIGLPGREGHITQGSDPALAQDNAVEKAAYVSQPGVLVICQGKKNISANVIM